VIYYLVFSSIVGFLENVALALQPYHMQTYDSCMLRSTLSLMFCGPFCNVRTLSLVRSKWASQVLDAIACSVHCRNIESLDLNWTSVNDEDCKKIQIACPFLKNLQLFYCREVTGKGIRAICTLPLLSLNVSGLDLCHEDFLYMAQNMPKLESLRLWKCRGLLDRGLLEIAQRCTALSMLNISGCSFLSSGALAALPSIALKLSILHVSTCKITNEFIMSVRSHLIGLHTLNISYCHDLTALSCLTFPLRELHLTGIPHLSSAALAGAIKFMGTFLVVLNVADAKCTDELFLQLAIHCNNLQDLDCLGSKISDDALVAVARGCRMLIRLNVGNCAALSDTSVTELAQNCHNLESCDLSSIDQLTDRSIVSLAFGCPCLQSLSLAGLPSALSVSHARIGDEAAFALGTMKRLTSIDLLECKGLTDYGLYALVNAPLEDLNLSGCPRLTSRGFCSSISKLPALRILKLYSNQWFDDECVEQLAHSCRKKLERLEFSSAVARPDSLIALAESCPRLMSVKMFRAMCSDMPSAKVGLKTKYPWISWEIH